jgi:hypothetical protein
MKTIQAGRVFVISDRCQGAVYTPHEYFCKTLWVANRGLFPAPFRFSRQHACRNINGQRVNLTYPGSGTVGGVEFRAISVVRIRVA